MPLVAPSYESYVLSPSLCLLVDNYLSTPLSDEVKTSLVFVVYSHRTENYQNIGLTSR